MLSMSPHNRRQHPAMRSDFTIANGHLRGGFIGLHRQQDKLCGLLAKSLDEVGMICFNSQLELCLQVPTWQRQRPFYKVFRQRTLVLMQQLGASGIDVRKGIRWYPAYPDLRDVRVFNPTTNSLVYLITAYNVITILHVKDQDVKRIISLQYNTGWENCRKEVSALTAPVHGRPGPHELA